MRLHELSSLLLLSRIKGDGNVEFFDIEMDSRRVKPCDLFVCVPGLAADGHDFAPQAVEQGAAALIVQRELDLPVPQWIVKDARYALAVAADHFFGNPSHEMKVIGVTGTNGKTTTSHLIETILRDQGHRTGLMGTVGIRIDGKLREAGRTTEESLELQRLFRQMRESDTQYCVMEVSSHALEMGRVKGCRFRTAVFTNLTQDHLDYHGTMEKYKAAKGLLFSRLGNAFSANPNEHCFAVLNADDAASADYAKMTSAQIISYGLTEEADVRALDIGVTAEGTEFTVSCFAGEMRLKMKLIGKFNVYNALAAFSAALAEGVPLERIKSSLEQVNAVEGRMEVVRAGQPFLVLVDYAHTPDGLENALSTIKEFAQGEIITVFGCGGDRDRGKRPIMGEIAAKYSDRVIVTSDNPRTEDPQAILCCIEPGVRGRGLSDDRVEFIVDRRLAIQQAIEKAGPKDVVLIAGKGHETYQIIGKTVHDFDDRVEAKNAIRRILQ